MATLLFPLNRLILGAGLSRRGVPPPMAGVMYETPSYMVIQGITKDETGAAAAGFTVYLMAMRGLNNDVPTLIETTISDAGGGYSFTVGSGEKYWILSYLVGTPDKAGATKNNLVGA